MKFTKVGKVLEQKIHSEFIAIVIVTDTYSGTSLTDTSLIHTHFEVPIEISLSPIDTYSPKYRHLSILYFGHVNRPQCISLLCNIHSIMRIV